MSNAIYPVSLVVTGTRRELSYEECEGIRRVFWRVVGLTQAVAVFHGAATGVDTAVAVLLGLSSPIGDPVPAVHAHPADWRPGGKLDRGAGHRRNRSMVADAIAKSRRVYGLAFPDRQKHPGTLDCISVMISAGIVVRVCPLPQVSE